MAGFGEGFSYPIEDKFALSDNDPIRGIERKTISRIRFTVCLHLPELSKHLEATARIGLKLCDALGLSTREKERIWYAASVHDLGKIGVNPLILAKENSLTDSEFLEVRNHTILGHELFSGIDGEIYKTCAEVALSHHERWDGGGYPNGLDADRIPLAAKIVAIADVYDCIVSGRPYQRAQTPAEANRELIECAGTQFDPELIEVFSRSVHPV